jgi:trimethylamine--corrinoid protein Co-methyltransferase
MRRGLHAGRLGSGGLSLNVFTADELDDIHLATLEVLERVGVFVEDDVPLDIYSDGGCIVDSETHNVRIPASIVEDAIRSAPANVFTAGRDPKDDRVLAPGRTGFINFCEGVKYNDPYTGENRDPLKKDVADCARLVDAMSEIDGYDSAIAAADVPTETYALHGVEAALLNTTKSVGCEATNKWEARKCIELAAIVAGGEDKLRERPLVYFCECPVSPLKITRDAAEVIMGAARHGIPNNVTSMAMSGASSPVTLAGTLVTHNCEVLASLTLAQLTERGAPTIYGSSTTAMDLRFAAASVGSPELGLISAGVAQLAQRYLLPSFVAGL